MKELAFFLEGYPGAQAAIVQLARTESPDAVTIGSDRLCVFNLNGIAGPASDCGRSHGDQCSHDGVAVLWCASGQMLQRRGGGTTPPFASLRPIRCDFLIIDQNFRPSHTLSWTRLQIKEQRGCTHAQVEPTGTRCRKGTADPGVDCNMPTPRFSTSSSCNSRTKIRPPPCTPTDDELHRRS
jgi:hypothetical protein